MSVLIFLIPITLALGFVGLATFIWSMKSGQFDDLKGNASRILYDDLEEKSNRSSSRKDSKASRNKKPSSGF